MSERNPQVWVAPQPELRAKLEADVAAGKAPSVQMMLLKIASEHYQLPFRGGRGRPKKTDK